MPGVAAARGWRALVFDVHRHRHQGRPAGGGGGCGAVPGLGRPQLGRPRRRPGRPLVVAGRGLRRPAGRLDRTAIGRRALVDGRRHPPSPAWPSGAIAAPRSWCSPGPDRPTRSAPGSEQVAVYPGLPAVAAPDLGPVTPAAQHHHREAGVEASDRRVARIRGGVRREPTTADPVGGHEGAGPRLRAGGGRHLARLLLGPLLGSGLRCGQRGRGLAGRRRSAGCHHGAGRGGRRWLRRNGSGSTQASRPAPRSTPTAPGAGGASRADGSSVSTSTTVWSMAWSLGDAPQLGRHLAGRRRSIGGVLGHHRGDESRQIRRGRRWRDRERVGSRCAPMRATKLSSSGLPPLNAASPFTVSNSVAPSE